MPDQDYDRELDEALAALYPDVHVDKGVQAKVRAELLRAAQAAPARKRRFVPIAAVAAAVAVVAVGALVVVTAQPDDIGPAQPGAIMPRPPATSDSQHAPMPPMPDQPQNTLHTLASRVTDMPLAPTQFRYVSNHLWRRLSTEGHSGATYTYVAEATTKTWIPADQQQEWLRRAHTLPNRQWITGTEQDARADNAPIDGKLVLPDGEMRAACGEFMPERGTGPCERRPVATIHTPGRIVPVPTDPRQLYDVLVEASATHADPPLQFFRTATRLFDSRYSAAVRRAVIEVMSRHPYVTVSSGTTRDSRPAISVAITYGPEESIKEELLLDPANGGVIGRRTAVLKAVDGAKAGDVISDEVQAESVADKIGVEPTR